MNLKSPLSFKTYFKAGARLTIVASVVVNVYSLILPASLYWLVLFGRDELAWLYVWAVLCKVTASLLEKFSLSHWWLLMVWELVGLLRLSYEKAGSEEASKKRRTLAKD